MVGQKQRIFRRFEREAEKKREELKRFGLDCLCGKCDLVKFNLKEIKGIISLDDNPESLNVEKLDEMPRDDK